MGSLGVVQGSLAAEVADARELAARQEAHFRAALANLQQQARRPLHTSLMLRHALKSYYLPVEVFNMNTSLMLKCNPSTPAVGGVVRDGGEVGWMLGLAVRVYWG